MPVYNQPAYLRQSPHWAGEPQYADFLRTNTSLW